METCNTHPSGLAGIELQWGHAFVSVETRRLSDYIRVLVLLQWGHAFVSVENAPVRVPGLLSDVLQWGHAFVSVETRRATLGDRCARLASMGPRFCKRGNILKEAPLFILLRCGFNGATLL